MSYFTIQLREVLEGYADIEHNPDMSFEQIISIARPIVFDFNYPIFDPEYKEELETKILFHFYTREIGEETFGLWKLRLRTTLNEIMPYYNQLYKSTLLEFEPLYTDEVIRSGAYTDKGDGVNTGKGTNWQMFSDTPQGSVSGLEENKYLTSATKNTNDNTNTTQTNSHRDYWEKVGGRTGRSGATMLMEYRKTFLNIDMMIIKDLEQLFFGLWE